MKTLRFLPLLGVLFALSVVAQGIGGSAGIGGTAGFGGGAATGIGEDGTCSVTSATSCTFSATATNDLKIVIAYGSSTTTPTVPGTMTAVFSSTAAPHHFVVACNRSSSSGDTGSGTFTNAVAITGVSYSGAATGTTANCNTTGVGANAIDGASSSTFRYDALTLNHTDGTSWVAGGGTASSAPGAPSGMTSRVSNSIASMSDTNGVVSSWSQQTVTVGAAAWASYTLEILEH
jgi:hypothetical protein